MAHRIDTHHHFLPPAYLSALGADAIGSPSSAGVAPPWNAQADLEEMAANGVATAVLSISAPGVFAGSESATVRVARECNEFGAGLVRAHPAAFRFFASLPLPSVRQSIAEIDYAFDALAASGVVLMTNYGDRYLGDDAFVPVLDQLNARDAVAFVHPTVCSAPSCHAHANPSMLEFLFDTARTIVSLLFSRRHLQFPRIRFLFSHAGGAISIAAGRVAMRATHLPQSDAAPVLDVRSALARFYYDTAGQFDAATYAFVSHLIAPEHLLFGTDYPFARSMAASVAAVAALPIGDAERMRIERGNAARLLGLRSEPIAVG